MTSRFRGIGYVPLLTGNLKATKVKVQLGQLSTPSSLDSVLPTPQT